MKYIELFQEPTENDYIYFSNLIHNEDAFFENDIIEKITDENLKHNVLEQIKINNHKDNINMENFVRKTLNKNKNDAFLFIEKIPNEIINNYAEIIYKEISKKNDKERNLIKNENNENEKNLIPKKNNELIIHNIFLEFTLINIRKKVEFRNQ